MATEITTYRVKDVMSSVVISVEPDDTIHEALVLMTQYRVTVLPVTDARDRCIGILSTSDLMDPTRQLEEELHDVERMNDEFRERIIDKLTRDHVGQQKVSELMTGSVTAVNRETSIVEATGEMLRHRVHHLPVVNESQKLLGIVSTMDILTAFHRHHTESV